MSEAEIVDRYRYLLESRRCLMGLGYAIPPPPGEEAFVESWLAAEGEGLVEDAPWSPYLDLPEDAFDEAEEACPQLPPGP